MLIWKIIKGHVKTQILKSQYDNKYGGTVHLRLSLGGKNWT